MSFTYVKSNIRQQSGQLKENNIRQKQSHYPSIILSGINKLEPHTRLYQQNEATFTQGMPWFPLSRSYVKSTPVIQFTPSNYFLHNVFGLCMNTGITYTIIQITSQYPENNDTTKLCIITLVSNIPYSLSYSFYWLHFIYASYEKLTTHSKTA